MPEIPFACQAVAIWYAPHERNIPAMLVSASSLGGYLLSWAGLGFVVEHTGWQGAFFFPGAVTLAFTVWFFLRMSDAPERMGFPNYERFAPKAAQPQDSAAQNISLWSFQLGFFLPIRRQKQSRFADFGKTGLFAVQRISSH